MKKSPFVSLIFKGPRFGEAAMPLETLPELAAYRELIIETAKALFQARNSTRQRPPKGFESGLQLVLERVILGLPTPYIYPTPEGLARAEWSSPKWEVIVNLHLSERMAEVIAVRVDSDRVDEDRFVLSQPGAESKLGRFLTEHLEAD
jgi:hypothetical protein